jgi:hypothetical protein
MVTRDVASSPHDDRKYIISSYSAAKIMPEIAEVKHSSCRLEVAGLRKNCDCGIAVAEQRSFKSCIIAIAEVLPSSCRIEIADSKKSCTSPPLVTSDKDNRDKNYFRLVQGLTRNDPDKYLIIR